MESGAPSGHTNGSHSYTQWQREQPYRHGYDREMLREADRAGLCKAVQSNLVATWMPIRGERALEKTVGKPCLLELDNVVKMRTETLCAAHDTSRDSTTSLLRLGALCAAHVHTSKVTPHFNFYFVAFLDVRWSAFHSAEVLSFPSLRNRFQQAMRAA